MQKVVIRRTFRASTCALRYISTQLTRVLYITTKPNLSQVLECKGGCKLGESSRMDLVVTCLLWEARNIFLGRSSDATRDSTA